MRWSSLLRVSTGTAMGVVTLGVTSALGLMSVFASDLGRPGFMWWWPTGWMAGPVAVTMLGVVQLVVPVVRGTGPLPEIQPEHVPSPNLMSRYVVGDGVQGYSGPFRRAVKDLSNQMIEQADGTRRPVSILEPRSEVYADGPGVVQDFDSGDSEYGWALCALAGRPVVAIDGKVWNDLRAAGCAALAEHPRTALGYPAPDENETGRIDADVLRVKLIGGTWGEGYLVREAVDRPWRWEPEPSFSMHPIPEAASWDRDSVGERLRLRVVSVLPLAGDGEIAAASTARRETLLAQLAHAPLTSYIIGLSTARGAKLPLTAWRKGPNRNARDWVSYSCNLLTRDRRSVLFVHVFMQLDKYASTDVETWVELEIHDLDAWKDAVIEAGGTPGADLRISPAEIADFFATAWHTSAVLLPSLASDKLATRYTRPPCSQFTVATDRAAFEPYPPLNRYVDLRSLAEGGRDDLERMTIAIEAAPPASLDHSARVAGRALVEMAQQYGFLDASPQSFQLDLG